MPRKGVRAPIGLPPGPLHDLTHILRDCCAGFSTRHIEGAASGHMSKTTVDNLLNGRIKRPHWPFVEALHELAGKRTGDNVPSVPDLDSVRRLYAQVLRQSMDPWECKTCKRAWNFTAPSDTAEEPADAMTTSLARDTALPVYPVQGDRQSGWSGIADLPARAAASQGADLAGMLRYVGQYGELSETAEAISDCRKAGLGEEVEALFVYAAQRPDEEIIGLAAALLDSNDMDAARELMARRLENR